MSNISIQWRMYSRIPIKATMSKWRAFTVHFLNSLKWHSSRSVNWSNSSLRNNSKPNNQENWITVPIKKPSIDLYSTRIKWFKSICHFLLFLFYSRTLIIILILSIMSIQYKLLKTINRSINIHKSRFFFT